MDTHYAVVDSLGAISSIYSSPYRFVRCDEQVSDISHYYDNKQECLLPKRKLQTSITTDGLVVTLSGLPRGLTVSTNGATATTEDDDLTIEYDLPGTYKIELSGLVEYLDHELEVTVDDA
jgi:hypothetical protein